MNKLLLKPAAKPLVFVLCLLGFVTTGFVITITLSAADATKHIAENPFTPELLKHHDVGVTLVLIALLGIVFLKGFSEAIGIAVGVVAAFLVLNLIVIGTGLYQVITHPTVLTDWRAVLFGHHPNPFSIIGASLMVFPALAKHPRHAP